MKKVVIIIWIALFAVSSLQAQSTDILTNTTIIKMVKGKLSDDLIIDEINSSKVNFDLSDEAVKTLSAGNVSDKVIEAMKAANSIQNPATTPAVVVPAVIAAPAVIAVKQADTSAPAEAAAPAVFATTAVVAVAQADTSAQDETVDPAAIPAAVAAGAVLSEIGQAADTSAQAITEEPALTEEETSAPAVAAVEETASQPEKEQPETETVPAKELLWESEITENGTLITIEKPALTIDALSYVIPVAELIPFYNKEFDEFAGVIMEWDKKLRASLDKEKQNNDAISKLEKELTDMKNADAKPFSNEILEQKKRLVSLWEKHKAIKAEMANEGKKLAEDLKKISKEKESAIDVKYKEVSKNVKNVNPNPSAGGTAKAIDIPVKSFKSSVTGYFSPSAMMLVCFQNEIITIENTIASWNKKALERIQKDAELKSRLAPLEEELAKYLGSSKQDQKAKKKEISALKKQCDGIEKERKQLAKQMNSDSDKLSEDLNKMNDEAQAVVRERFADITENIEHSYQDKFNL